MHKYTTHDAWTEVIPDLILFLLLVGISVMLMRIATEAKSPWIGGTSFFVASIAAWTFFFHGVSGSWPTAEALVVVFPFGAYLGLIWGIGIHLLTRRTP